MLRFISALCLLIFFTAPAYSGTSWQGKVVYITDGDTLWVQPLQAMSRTNDDKPRKIRIEGIDAPEICQLHGPQSKAALTQLLAKQTVTVNSRRVDDYGRDVAKITFNQIDVGTWMVSNGHAWSYHYRHSAGPYASEEQMALAARRGLFAFTSPMEPRDFRKKHGSCHTPRN